MWANFLCLAVAQQRKRHIKRVWEAREAARKFQSCVLPRFISLYEADILAVRGTGWWQTRFLLNYCQNLSLAVIESDANCCARSLQKATRLTYEWTYPTGPTGRCYFLVRDWLPGGHCCDFRLKMEYYFLRPAFVVVRLTCTNFTFQCVYLICTHFC